MITRTRTCCYCSRPFTTRDPKRMVCHRGHCRDRYVASLGIAPAGQHRTRHDNKPFPVEVINARVVAMAKADLALRGLPVPDDEQLYAICDANDRRAF